MLALAVAGAAARNLDTNAMLAWRPLAAQPFFAAAGSAKGQRRAELLQEAIHRDPRAPELRLALIQNLVRSGRMPAAVDQLAILRRLEAPLTDEVLAKLASQIVSPSRARAVAEAFGKHPELFVPILSHLTQSPDKAPAVTLIRHLPPKAFDIAPVRAAAIGILADGGEYRRAYALWSGSLAPAPPLRDPDFSGNTPEGPFSWRFTSGDAGAADRTPDGLELVAFGQQSGVLADQLLLLAPGSWRITLDYEIIDHANGGIALALRCQGSGQPLASVVLEGSAGSRRTISLDAVVPRGDCAGQRLQIETGPSDDLKDMHARAFSMHVTRAAS